MRLTLSHFLAVVAFVMLCGLVGQSLRHRQQMHRLRTALEKEQSILAEIEYGSANLRLLGIHPEVWEDPKCSRFFQHELAISIIHHWRLRTEIDHVTDTPGDALEFVGEALAFFDCTSAEEFIALVDSRLSIYPDDELDLEFLDWTDQDRRSFAVFIRKAVSRQTK